jgi:hypothetical protein
MGTTIASRLHRQHTMNKMINLHRLFLLKSSDWSFLTAFHSPITERLNVMGHKVSHGWVFNVPGSTVVECFYDVGKSETPSGGNRAGQAHCV